MHISFSFTFWLNIDILYLHKQRVKAMEELQKTKEEKQLLLDKVEQLEAKIKPGVGKVDCKQLDPVYSTDAMHMTTCIIHNICSSIFPPPFSCLVW